MIISVGAYCTYPTYPGRYSQSPCDRIGWFYYHLRLLISDSSPPRSLHSGIRIRLPLFYMRLGVLLESCGGSIAFCFGESICGSISMARAIKI